MKEKKETKEVNYLIYNIKDVDIFFSNPEEFIKTNKNNKKYRDKLIEHKLEIANKIIKEEIKNTEQLLEMDFAKNGDTEINIRAINELKNEYIEKINNLKKQLQNNMNIIEEEKKYYEKNIPFAITINDVKKIDYNKLNNLCITLKKYNLEPSFVVYDSDDLTCPKFNYTKKELIALKNLNDFLLLKNKNKGLEFCEYQKFHNQNWNLQEVCVANKNILKFVDEIKQHNYTPFETMLHLHNKISKFSYKEAEDNNKMQSRSIVGAFNSDKIVCVGYAYIMKAIIDKLEMPGLKCSNFHSGMINKILINDEFAYNIFLEKSGHIQSLIEIDDAKYKIKGVYAEDACWDSGIRKYVEPEEIIKGNKEVLPIYTHCLVPFSDLYKERSSFYYTINFANMHKFPMCEISKNKNKIKKFENKIEITKKHCYRKEKFLSLIKNNNLMDQKTIPMETFRAGLNVVNKNEDSEYFKLKTEKILQKSLIASNLYLKPSAISAFVDPIKDKEMR